jgi:quercetin dioxygenase-like cupin family protein
MINRKLAVASFISISFIAPAGAQTQGITRQVMQTTEFPAGLTTTSAIGTMAAGVCAGAHIHPGLETSYMLEGELTLKVEGKPDLKVKAGDSLQVPIAAKHDACNTGNVPAKWVSVYVIERGKPIAAPAP